LQSWYGGSVAVADALPIPTLKNIAETANTVRSPARPLCRRACNEATVKVYDHPLFMAVFAYDADC